MLVFLLFAHPFGASIQAKFTMALLPQWRAWAESNKKSILETANYKMNDEEIAEFIELAEEYLYCMIQRYQNMRSKRAQVESRGAAAKPAPLRRCDSFTYSICLEGAGILASELLHPPTMVRALKLNEENNSLSEEEKAVRNYVVTTHEVTNPQILRQAYARLGERKIKNVVEERITKENRNYAPGNTLQFVGRGAEASRGYTNIRFGKFAAVLLSFLSSESELILAPYNEITPFILKDGSKFWQMVKNSSPGSMKAAFCYEGEVKDYQTLRGIEIFNKPLLESIPKECKVSTAVSTNLIRNNTTVGGHAILFLQCESGEQFLYDDNYGKLLKIKWRNPITNLKCDGYWYVKPRNEAIQPYLIVFKKDTGGLYQIFGEEGGETKKPVLLEESPEKEVFQISGELSSRNPAEESIFQIVGYSLCIVSLDGLQKQVKASAGEESSLESNMNSEGFWYARPPKPEGGRRRFKRATRRATLKRRGRSRRR